MNISTFKFIVCTAALFLPVIASATSDLTISVNITGDVDELMALLEKLKELGVGEAADEGEDEPMRVQVHSVTTKIDPAPAPQIPIARRPVSVISLSKPTVLPAHARPGESVLVSVQVTDPNRQIDTVAATLRGVNGFIFDLYDNGTRGDRVAGDGTWSYALDVPSLVGAQEYTIVVTAYDRSGTPIEVPGASGEKMLLSSEVSLPISR